MAKIILEIQTRGLNQYHRLESFPVTIGRALDNDIILSDNSVSPYHLRLEQDETGQIFIHNLSDENGTRLNSHKLGQQPVSAPVPSQLLLGNRKARLVSAGIPVEMTHVSRCSGIFSPLCKPLWAGMLLLLAIVSLLVNDYLDVAIQKDALFYISGLLPSLLWILLWTLLIGGVSRLVTHRWEFVPALSVVSLFTLIPLILQEAGDWLDYFFTSDSPSNWLVIGVGDFLLLPILLYAYLHWVLSQKHRHSLGIALVLSALPLGLRGMNLLDQITADSEFSSEPYYQQTLSSLNMHARPALSLEQYLKQAAEELPSQVEE
ncbi:MAG: FHA domain-containing protein [Thiothrix sp.]